MIKRFNVIWLSLFVSFALIQVPYLHSVKLVRRKPKKEALPRDVKKLQKLVSQKNKEIAKLKKEVKQARKGKPDKRKESKAIRQLKKLEKINEDNLKEIEKLNQEIFKLQKKLLKR